MDGGGFGLGDVENGQNEAISVELDPDVQWLDVPVFFKGPQPWHCELPQVPCSVECGHEAAVNCSIMRYVEVQLVGYSEYKIRGVEDPLLPPVYLTLPGSFNMDSIWNGV